MARNTTSDKVSGVSPTIMVDAMRDMQSAGFKSLSLLGAAWMGRVNGFGSEVAQFVADRLQEDMKLQHQLMHCKDLRQVQEVQTRFLRTALEQYTAETGKLVSMGSDMLGETLSATRKQ